MEDCLTIRKKDGQTQRRSPDKLKKEATCEIPSHHPQDDTVWPEDVPYTN